MSFTPNGVRACDQIVEQLPPVEAWGKQFITAPLKSRESFHVFHNVAAENRTIVNIICIHHSCMEGYIDNFSLKEVGFTDIQVNSAESAGCRQTRELFKNLPTCCLGGQSYNSKLASWYIEVNKLGLYNNNTNYCFYPAMQQTMQVRTTATSAEYNGMAILAGLMGFLLFIIYS